MRTIFTLLTLMLLVLAPKEGYVSQVVYREQPMAEVIQFAADIVKVENLNRSEEIKRVVFPKETSVHGSESSYVESVNLYKVLETLRGNLKPGDIIKVAYEPSYTEEDMRRYHEEGLSKSPSVPHYGSDTPVEKGKPSFLFVYPRKGTDLYMFRGEHGPGSEQKIRELEPKTRQYLDGTIGIPTVTEEE